MENFYSGNEMLNQVLYEIEKAQGPITLHELSRKLGMDTSALEGMLQFWERKGRIQNDDGGETCESQIGSCSSSCNGPGNCAFIAKMPKTYSIPTEHINGKSGGGK